MDGLLYCSIFYLIIVFRKFGDVFIDNIVKSRFKDYIPACAGMTSMVSIDINCPTVIPAQAGIQKRSSLDSCLRRNDMRANKVQGHHQ